jgi:hypothetical protein
LYVHSFLRALGQTELLHRLLYALEGAEDAFLDGSAIEREWALSESLAVIGELYGSLDSITSPEASAHLASMCDACLSAVGEAYAGDPDALEAAAAFVRAMRGALVADATRPRMAA